jgi:hypothetical protein
MYAQSLYRGPTEGIQGKSKDQRKNNTLNPVARARFMNTDGDGTSGSLI